MLTTTATELPRLMRCIGSRLMRASVPDNGDTDARDEGNAADWLAEQLFAGTPVQVGDKAPNGWAITDDMMDHVRLYLDALGTGGDMQVVTTFAGETWEVRGRADHIVYEVDGLSRLTVSDLKYGHRIVSPEENWTLLAHAIGECINKRIQPDHVVLRIIQPRPYHADGPVRSWEVPGGYAGLVERYHAIAARLSNPTNELVSGLDQCAKCHARYDCPAFDRSVWNALDVVMEGFHDAMPNHVLAIEYEQFEYAEQLIKTKREAVAELMTHRIKSGQVIAGYGLENRQGQRRWAKGLTGAVLSAATGVGLSLDAVVTPAEAERRGVDKDVVAALTERPMIGSKLKKVDPDAMVRRVFQNGGGTR